jgi:hypothetical protein
MPLFVYIMSCRLYRDLRIQGVRRIAVKGQNYAELWFETIRSIKMTAVIARCTYTLKLYCLPMSVHGID